MSTSNMQIEVYKGNKSTFQIEKRLEPLARVCGYMLEREVQRRWRNIIYLVLKPLYLHDQMNQYFKSNFLRNFEINQMLGGGSFGVVYKVEKRHLIGNEYDVVHFGTDTYNFEKYFAIKIVPNYGERLAMNEVKHLSALVHPNIVKCYNAWSETSRISTSKAKQNDFSNHAAEWEYIESLIPIPSENLTPPTSSQSRCPHVMFESTDILEICLFIQYELCTDGTLDDLLKDRMIQNSLNISNNSSPEFKTYRIRESQNIFMQILEGLVFLEYNGIVHGDLKPNNIFLLKNFTGIVAKIGDFGLSMKSSDVFVQKLPQDFANVEIDPMDPRQYYHAPEYLKGIFTIRGDIYALGVIFIMMLCNFKADLNSEEDEDKFRAKNSAVIDLMYVKRYRKYPKDFKLAFPKEYQWVKKMISHNPSKRPSPSELKDWIFGTKEMAQEMPQEVTQARAQEVTQTRTQEVTQEITQDLSVTDISKEYQINYGDQTRIEILECMLHFVLKFIAAHDLKNGYRYLNEYFYEGLRTLEIDDPNLCSITEAISNIGMTLRRFEDNYYREKMYLSKIEAKLGQDHPTTLTFQMLLYINLKELDLSPQTEHSPPRVTETFNELIEKIEISPVYQRLPESDPIKLEYQLVECSLALQNDNPEKLTEALEKIRRVSLIRRKLIEEEEEEDSPNFENLVSCLLMESRILEKLGKISEANQIYLATISEFISHPEIGLNHSMTRQAIRSYADALTRWRCYAQARPYSEALCQLYRERDDLLSDYIDSLKDIVAIYDKLGLQEEVDLILKHDYYRNYVENEFYMVSSGFNKIWVGFDVHADRDDFAKGARAEFGLSKSSHYKETGERLDYDDSINLYVLPSEFEGWDFLDYECHPEIIVTAMEFWEYLQTQKVSIPWIKRFVR